ncbi:MAG: 50S ribosomal protein L7 [Bacilli bacterium]|jgi:ribosomal protein L7Ae-like RNA K-turn-binding protein|nr:50S ribosomal protein L7 [Bacilli bacterium]
MKEKVLNLLGLAQRAGFIVSGEEANLLALQHGRLKILFVAKDASDRTKDKFNRKCYFYKVMCNFEFTSEELSSALGKQRKIVGLTDQGFFVTLEKWMR